ncbi:3693_t:CDS:10 [Diversispora eburnea]|uniref:3693_t:CDS:1 n=1 Tax=Diversispora eburnea TaxID=1213867 RepID=A0A9N8Z8M4_9GLOM|nr:3693_t:CDS:10 [Diversispora eburnea]
MGIQCLLQSLKSIQTKISISKYAGKTVGVDAYCWLHKGIHTCIFELVQNQPTTKYVDFCMRRVKMLQSFDVRPFLVFDGGSLPAKLQTDVKREEKRQEYRKLGQKLYKEGRYEDALNILARGVDVTPEMAYKNIDYVVAPYEADAQLAYLEKKNRISAIITEDSDFLVFGCKTVYGGGIEICRDNFGKVQELNMVGWTDKQFREMTMLSGCDYLESISGIGLKSAYKYVKKYRSVEKVLTLLVNNGKTVVPPDYLNNFKRAELVFLYQRVFDLDTRSIVTLNPIPEELDITTDNDYIGPEIEPIIAIGIASGELDPFTKKPISKSKKLERTIVLPENSSFYFGGQTSNKNLPAKANWYSIKEFSTKKDSQIGKEGGIKDGIKAGELEGQTLGCEKGFELLQEIGFYDGVAEMWIKILKKGWNKKSTNESTETPRQYLERLQYTLSKSKLATMLAKRPTAFYQSALKVYMEIFDFENDPIDIALRKFLMECHLPKETQQIDQDDTDVNGQSIIESPTDHRTLKLFSSLKDRRKSSIRNRNDPYWVIQTKLPTDFKPNIEDIVPMENPYSYIGTLQSLDVGDLHRAFSSAQSIRVIGGGKLGRKVDMIDGKRTGNFIRNWKQYGVILSGSQLMFFKDEIWFNTQMNELKNPEKSKKLPTLRPDIILMTAESVAVYDKNYMKYPNVFRLVCPKGHKKNLHVGFKFDDSKDSQSRANLLRSKIDELQERISNLTSQLQIEIRFRNNLILMIPYKASTRDRIIQIATMISQKLKLTCLELSRLVCYHEILEKDLCATVMDNSNYWQHRNSMYRVGVEQLNKPLPSHPLNKGDHNEDNKDNGDNGDGEDDGDEEDNKHIKDNKDNKYNKHIKDNKDRINQNNLERDNSTNKITSIRFSEKRLTERNARAVSLNLLSKSSSSSIPYSSDVSSTSDSSRTTLSRSTTIDSEDFTNFLMNNSNNSEFEMVGVGV